MSCFGKEGKDNFWTRSYFPSFLSCVSSAYVVALLLMCQAIKAYSYTGTWMEAYRACRDNGSSIATTNQSGFWSPDVTFSTPWISLIDCLRIEPNHDMTVFKHPRDCVVFCLSRNISTFSLSKKQANIQCYCSNITADRPKGQCTFCDQNSSKLWCGSEDSVAIYHVFPNTGFHSYPDQQCLAVNCGHFTVYKAKNCTEEIDFICTNGTTDDVCVSNNGVKKWNEYPSTCGNSYLPPSDSLCNGSRLSTCSGSTHPNDIWLHTIRETVYCSAERPLCVDYIETVNVSDIQDMCCQFVTADSARKKSSCDVIFHDFVCQKNEETSDYDNIFPPTPALSSETPIINDDNRNSTQPSNKRAGPWVWAGLGCGIVLALASVTISVLICRKESKKRKATRDVNLLNNIQVKNQRNNMPNEHESANIVGGSDYLMYQPNTAYSYVDVQLEDSKDHEVTLIKADHQEAKRRQTSYCDTEYATAEDEDLNKNKEEGTSIRIPRDQIRNLDQFYFDGNTNAHCYQHHHHTGSDVNDQIIVGAYDFQHQPGGEGGGYYHLQDKCAHDTSGQAMYGEGGIMGGAGDSTYDGFTDKHIRDTIDVYDHMSQSRDNEYDSLGH